MLDDPLDSIDDHAEDVVALRGGDRFGVSVKAGGHSLNLARPGRHPTLADVQVPAARLGWEPRPASIGAGGAAPGPTN